MRTTNLIQSYVSATPKTQQYNSDKAVKDFDVHKELLNRTFIKPLPSNGKLVRNGLFDIPSQIRKDFMYDIRAFGHALKGEANDHELGRLNDVGLKVGGLAIASYLFTKKQTPMTKVFEFIGLGTFFAAMDLWPKLFIQLPAYLIHGVNVRQKYEDSFGRKKMFYQDHQFIPWDLYSDKEINKIGDRLNVPKDIPNRREFIQEKMRKIALQNNTLWMLTAGFATPILSALMCNILESPVSKYLSDIKNQKADNLLNNFSNEIKKYNNKAYEKRVNEILQSNLGKPVTPELFEKISSSITADLDYMVADAVHRDLKHMLGVGDKYTITSENIEQIREAVKKAYSRLNLSVQDMENLIPSSEDIVNILNSKALYNPQTMNEASFSDFSEHSKAIQHILETKIEYLRNEDPNNPIIRKLEFALKKLIHSPEINSDSELFTIFKKTPATVLTDKLVGSLKHVSKTLSKLNAETAILRKYSFIKAAQAPETILADAWNEVSTQLFDAMKFTSKEIKEGRLDRELAGEILRNKVEIIASNKNLYDEYMKVLESSISSLHGKLATLDMTQDSSINPFRSHVKESFDDAAKELRKFGMDNTVESLIGFGDNAATSKKALMLEFINQRTLGVKSSFYRILNMFDFYHKIADKTYIFENLKNYPREVKEECIELAKRIILEAHTSDFAEKFPYKRNPEPNKSDFSEIQTIMGKVINKYLGQTPNSSLAEFSNDRHFFENVMKIIFDGNLHTQTEELFKDSAFLQDFKNYRKQVLDVLGGDFNFAKPNFLVNGRRVDSPSILRFLLLGSSSDEMAFKYLNQTYNSGKWFSKFGKLGAGLISVTILAQFFFGRMKAPGMNKEGGK